MHFPSTSVKTSQPPLALGLDAGGTQTRWALATPDGQIAASGELTGLSALQAGHAAGLDAIARIFAELAHSVAPHGRVGAIHAGITGYGGEAQALPQLLAHSFALPAASVCVKNDLEIAYLDIFEPGSGYLIYAGTGSIAAYIDQQGQFQRAGGRGYLLDDGGGGFWIAREALRHIWRQEDEQPGSWRHSPMARKLFAQMDCSDWDATRQFIYQRSRGEIGRLALAVAAAADSDAIALDILHRAGQELARLGMALCTRYGKKPLTLSGRVPELHPVISETLRSCLPAGLSLQLSTCQAHLAAARLAAKQLRKHRLNQKASFPRKREPM
ncbi:MAG: ATPase [Burkholderiales bacterium]|nr:ATPase [Burkholderiales bacterium]